MESEGTALCSNQRSGICGGMNSRNSMDWYVSKKMTFHSNAASHRRRFNKSFENSTFSNCSSFLFLCIAFAIIPSAQGQGCWISSTLHPTVYAGATTVGDLALFASGYSLNGYANVDIYNANT